MLLGKMCTTIAPFGPRLFLWLNSIKSFMWFTTSDIWQGKTTISMVYALCRYWTVEVKRGTLITCRQRTYLLESPCSFKVWCSRFFASCRDAVANLTVKEKDKITKNNLFMYAMTHNFIYHSKRALHKWMSSTEGEIGSLTCCKWFVRHCLISQLARFHWQQFGISGQLAADY
jgi:hypothetical protein